MAELTSGSNHFVCCGSAINVIPHDHTMPSNGHADLIWSKKRVESNIVCYRALEYCGTLFTVGRLYCWI